MKNIKICLDSGHYGTTYNQSPEVKSYYESQQMWVLHLLLKKELELRGFQVITTRSNQNTDLDVYNRGAMSKGCDCFISLHSNACGTESVDYSIVYRAFDNHNNVDPLAVKLGKEIGILMGNKQTGKSGTNETDVGTEFYGVMRGARAVNCPIYLLIEHSFHTNKTATNWLLVEENLKKLAVLEADILGEHFGMDVMTDDVVELVDESNYTAIMGDAQITAGQMKSHLLSVNPDATAYASLADIFVAEGQAEGVRGDIAFAQAIVETGYFKFGGDVKADQNNFCGLGATGNGEPGLSFDSLELGARAQIQHLQAYATSMPLLQVCVDPRYKYVNREVAPYVEWLGIQENPEKVGWAMGANYGAKILAVLDKMAVAEEMVLEEIPTEPVKEVPDWLKPAVDWAVENSLVVGDGNGDLRLFDHVTRGELLVVLKALDDAR